MTARLQQFFLAVQLLATILLSWWIDRHYGAHIGALGSIALGISLIGLVHPAMVLCGFVLSRLAASPVPVEDRIGILAAFKTCDAELDASVRTFDWAQPFFDQTPTPFPEQPYRPVPVLFIHGYFCNRAVWLPTLRAAAARGYHCEAISLEQPFADIDAHVERVAAAIERLLALAGATRVILVGHSMGGLVARAYLRAQDDARVAHVITLGTPHHGTVHARLGQGLNARQMRRHSPWLAVLAASESAELRARFTSIYSYHDNLVAPQLSAHLEGATNIALSGYGHLAMLYAPAVRERVFAILDAVAAPAAQSADVA